MADLLDFIRLEEAVELCILAALFAFIGGQMARLDSETYVSARRITAAVFFLYTVFGIYAWGPTSVTELLLICIRALLASGLAFGLALLTLAPTVFLISQAKAFIPKKSKVLSLAPTPPHTPVIEPRSPQVSDQERQEVLEERRLEENERLLAEQRREEARLRSELLYERHARQLASSFPRDRFEQFMERYMGEATSPDLVEQRELLLRETILDSLGKSPAPKFSSMTELAEFFAARRLEIDALPHDEDAKDAYKVQLNKQEDEALRKLLQP